MSNAVHEIRTSISPVWQELSGTLAARNGSTEGILPRLMILLTIVTGLVDALAYLRLGHVFVANMTGNVVFLGFAAAGAGGLSLPGSLLALGSFLLGSVAAARLAARLSDDRLRQLRAATAIEAVACAGAIPIAALAGHQPGAGSRYTLIVLLAAAMGVQNATARRLAVPELTTTVLTMTLTGIAADSRLGGGSGAPTARRVLSVAAMLLGAIIGAVLLRIAPVAPLVLATGILATVVVSAQRAAGRDHVPG
jgi:uncharacterized membrane protein YoaK (UPF0700 family)